MSEFQAEAFFFHLVVALRIELIEECHFLVGHWERFVKLGHGELLRQQLETDWLEVNLATQFIGGLPQNQVVVECQRGHLVEREPLGFGCIVASLYLAETHQGEVGDGDDSLTRVTIHT